MKLTLNDVFKHAIIRDPDNIHPMERLLSGGLSGAVAQVGTSNSGMFEFYQSKLADGGRRGSLAQSVIFLSGIPLILILNSLGRLIST